MNLKDLAAEFPRDAVHWRAQSLTKNGDKAMALAYLDARDVMDRLDEVCGPENWQSKFTETAKGRVICELSIRTGDQWVTKSDGAGNTDVEGEKGGISDALKRAAVHWGIGRYLYRMPSPWVPCETYTPPNGKPRWSKWKADPWDFVRQPPKGQNENPNPPKTPLPDGLEPAKPPREVLLAIADIEGCQDQASLKDVWANLYKNYRMVADVPQVIAAKDKRKSELTKDAA